MSLSAQYYSDGRSTGYVYDSKNRISSQKENILGKSLNTGYTYNADSAVTAVTLGGNNKVTYEYDEFYRITKKTIHTATPYVVEYTYCDGADPDSTTSLVQSVKNGNDIYSYTYDCNGNILSVSLNGTVLESYTEAFKPKTAQKGCFSSYFGSLSHIGGSLMCSTSPKSTQKTAPLGS